jgi:chorismate synthase
MATLSYRTAGESHGPALIALIEGMPHGCPVDPELINTELKRRQGGYGRGGRQKIETDRVEFLAGVRTLGGAAKTIGSPIAIMVRNADNRLDDLAATPPLHRPRPGHADLAGAVKWLTDDCREVLERASARETTVRVAAGALAKCLLKQFGIEVFGFVRRVGDAATDMPILHEQLPQLIAERDASECYCPDHSADAGMKQFINQQKQNKDTAGGIVETHVFGCPVGIGSCLTWDGRLDSRIAAAVVGIQAFKGVEIGMGFEVARLPGSKVHD